mmetsp:Transcript_39518/g.60322  ORF Transcript_39518/g.60322 Transcript_39518/m.60322 type:complete len:114 (-) Transcript_39518:836-1177(-)
MEYNCLIERAITLGGAPRGAEGKDEALVAKRLAYIGIHGVTQYTIAEKGMWKPFTPLLGETFELQTDDFKFLSEQVSLDPPILANVCIGKNPEARYVFWNNQATSTRFTGSSL